MKLSILSFALASAALAVSASPLRVVVVSSSIETVNSGSVGGSHHIQSTHIEFKEGAAVVKHTPCSASRFRQKAKSMVATFRLALGFSSKSGDKKLHHHHHHHHKDEKNSHKHKESAALPLISLLSPSGPKPDRVLVFPVDVKMTSHHAHKEESFLMRVHVALMSLGPWEGRAVAFVLGCGIGVLLRMVWVLLIVSYRLIKGPSPEQDEYTVFDFDDAEELFVASPQYSYPVEKVAMSEPTEAEESK
ncbi:unnamed protein product [Mycena citricolor]|uniref:Uncharacterized protein n=1 Tax=Mycena citricolor TaxID=2018698 RepID=A0AAD2K233_9AGAR|nr:unnamed protein product [Mycena citricolor]